MESLDMMILPITYHVIGSMNCMQAGLSIEELFL